MPRINVLLTAVALGLATTGASAALTLNSIPNTGAAPAGFVSNDLTFDTDTDFLSAEIFVELSAGTLYNFNPVVPGVETFQQAPGDTFVTVNHDPGTLIAGGAGDLGHHNPANPGGAEFGPSVLGVTWASTAVDDIGVGLPLGTFSFSDDAMGSGQLSVVSSGISGLVPFTITNGAFPALSELFLTDDPLPPPPPPPPVPPPTPGLFANITLDTSVLGATQHVMTVTTDTDFVSAVILVNLSSGSIINPNSFAPGVETFFNAFPGNADTFVTANDNPATLIAGGAGDLGDPSAEARFGPSILSVTWLSPVDDTDDIGVDLPIGIFSITDDALGTFQLLVTNAAGDQNLISGSLPVLIPEPTTLGLFSLGGLALLRRRR